MVTAKAETVKIVLKSIAVVLIVALIVFCMVECIKEAMNAPTEGVVIDMGYQPERTTYVYRKIGKTSRMMPVHHSAYYWIEIRGMCQDGTKEGTNRFYVTKAIYESLKVGDYWKHAKE